MADDAQEKDAVRLDLWLWSVRIFKTRTLAAQACRKGAVLVGGAEAKPSRSIRVDDEITVQKQHIKLTLRVLQLLTRRVGAKLVAEYYEDCTPEEEIAAAKAKAREKWEGPQRQAGSGRPTKKDRRVLDEVEGGEVPELSAEDEAKREALFEKWMRESDL